MTPTQGLQTTAAAMAKSSTATPVQAALASKQSALSTASLQGNLARFWHTCALCSALVMPLLMTPPITEQSDMEELLDDSSGQYMQIGAAFFALAILAWTFVAAWLCYDTPSLSEGVAGEKGQTAEGELPDISESMLQRVAQGFADFIVENSKKEGQPDSGGVKALDLTKLEELVAVAPAAAASALYGLKGGGGGLLSCKDGTSRVTPLSLGKDLLGSCQAAEPGGAGSSTGGASSDSCGKNCGCNLLSGTDGQGPAQQLETPHLALFKEMLRERLVCNLTGEGSSKKDLGSDQANTSCSSGGGMTPLNLRLASWFSSAPPEPPPVEKPEKTPTLEESLGMKREALEDLLKQLLHAAPGEEKLSPGAAQKLRMCRAANDKDAASNLTGAPSMAEHAREVGNKYFQDRHYAAAAHCYEVACLLCPSGSGCPTEKLASYHCNCALACLELSRYSDAINECHAALALTPSKPLTVKALYRLAVAHLNLKNPWETRRCLHNLLELDPLNAYAQKLLEHLLDWQAEEKKRAEALPSPRRLAPLVWSDAGMRIQALGSAARAKSRRAKQKSGANPADEVRLLDREAGLWHTVARHNSKLYILGGLPDAADGAPLVRGQASCSSGAAAGLPEACGSDELHVLDVDSLELRQISGPGSKPPHTCYCHTATVAGNSMIVFGGLGPPLEQPPLVMVFDLVQAKWKVPQVTGTPPRQRQGHTANAVQDDRYLCVFGGLEPTAEQGVARIHNDTHLLDLVSFAWRKMECTGRPAARFGHTATNLPGHPEKLLVIGGRDHLVCRGDSMLQDHTGLHILDTERRTWSEQRFSGEPPKQAFYHSACLVDERTLLVACSGRGVSLQEDTMPLYVLDLEAWRWSRPAIQGVPPLPRIGQAAVAASGGRMYLFGGMVWRGVSTLVDKAVYVLESSQPPALPSEKEESERLASSQLERVKCSDRCKGEAAKDSEAGACAAKALPSQEAAEHKAEPERPEMPCSSGDANAPLCGKPAINEAAFASGAETTATTAAGTPCDSPRALAVSGGAGIRPPALVPTAPAKRMTEAVFDLEDEEFDDEPELSFEELLEQEKAFFKQQSEKASFPRAQEVRRKDNNAGRKNSRP
eukprot:TRINITY_DN65037_c0_g1_i1.p1 TRINITY_DN65037_c0_g1~~TRINITY_DN65037_c0_g1_i1.p1  ORF type:complete len:1107 (-),score=245.62 TRINITY_DN65037_c0_g1_i1:79-3399(-)